ncbi:Crp/Fnr family transcriptional regulator [Nitratireductor indicus]|uniref:Crp/FNR family transcriptional regulator n=1 Tax=Nitratireductor indicus C115 TaxID=1231190 RepID=K2MY66_9HYPH|nr:helix-turn-helix domain-containing protein [Nitratireductor indicus]EKF40153.1 Crp/FNR family transcriptional regulator [Nitratireductor indicus C115]MDS1138142.1 helix-turn-helix domain-containing protein [Nitratireductor indicus]SFQ80327.1 CRP/FNR family transcriptional regulator, anaerobic regulatory protein [Nitratireductor indicus]
MDAVSSVTPLTNCLSAQCSFCSNLSEPARAELARISRVRNFGAGETILAEAETFEIVGQVLSGVLRMQKTLFDGRQQIVGLLMPGDLFGHVFAHTSHVAIEAATEAVLCCYHRQSFEALFAQFPEIEHRMLSAVTEELDAAQDWMLLLATQTVTQRVATFFLYLRRKTLPPDMPHLIGPPVIEVPICRRDLAAYLGTTVESVSRSIQQMARERLIRILDPHRFELIDIEGLALLSHTEEEVCDMEVPRSIRAG